VKCMTGIPLSAGSFVASGLLSLGCRFLHGRITQFERGQRRLQGLTEENRALQTTSETVSSKIRASAEQVGVLVAKAQQIFEEKGAKEAEFTAADQRLDADCQEVIARREGAYAKKAYTQEQKEKTLQCLQGIQERVSLDIVRKQIGILKGCLETLRQLDSTMAGVIQIQKENLVLAVTSCFDAVFVVEISAQSGALAIEGENSDVQTITFEEVVEEGEDV